MSLPQHCCQEDLVTRLSIVDRLLPLWIVVSMVFGLLLGNYDPSVATAIDVQHIAGVSLPIALGLWFMMLPVLTKVRYELLPHLAQQQEVLYQFGVSTFLNWVIGPALMTALAWMFLPDLEHLRNGVVLVGMARCIAMVLVWNDVALGNRELCAMLVALNSILQVILYTPFTMFYMNLLSSSSVHVGWWLVARSVLVFLGVPLVSGVGLRYGIIMVRGKEWLEDRFLPYFSPVALLSLLYTIVVMFASQGEKILHQAAHVARVAVPLLLYFVIMYGVSFFIAWKKSYTYQDATTQAFTAAGNNFELAIAIAVATFGIQSQEALAATIGPLIEVPVLLCLAYFSLWLKSEHYEKKNDLILSP